MGRRRLGWAPPRSSLRREQLDGSLYELYSSRMRSGRKIDTKGVEEARKSLPAILDAAAQGRTTIITRRGNAVAAIGPAKGATTTRPASLLSLAGTGKGLWGRARASTTSRLRDEWSR